MKKELKTMFEGMQDLLLGGEMLSVIGGDKNHVQLQELMVA